MLEISQRRLKNMAVERLLERRNLTLIFDAGLKDGKQTTNSKTLAINSTASDENLKIVASELASLVERPLLKIRATEVVSIYEE